MLQDKLRLALLHPPAFPNYYLLGFQTQYVIFVANIFFPKSSFLAMLLWRTTFLPLLFSQIDQFPTTFHEGIHRKRLMVVSQTFLMINFFFIHVLIPAIYYHYWLALNLTMLLKNPNGITGRSANILVLSLLRSERDFFAHALARA